MTMTGPDIDPQTENVMSRMNSTKIGNIEIIALTDGATQFGAELFPEQKRPKSTHC